MAIFSISRIVTNTVGITQTEDVGYDLHPYWYSGHFIRQGVNPYFAFLNGLEPALPIAYMDGSIVESPPVAQPELGLTPANTAPMLLLLSVLSWLSWPVAKTVWLFTNLVLMLALPWLTMCFLPDRHQWPLSARWLLALLFYGWLGSRAAVTSGQTTLLVLTLSMGALLLPRRHWLIAGLILGLGLSKYSLALPFLLFLLYQRQIRLILVALSVQLTGTLAISMLQGATFLETIEAYITILQLHLSQPGIHLSSFLAGYDFIIIISLLLLTGLTWGSIGLWLWRADAKFNGRLTFQPSARLHLLAILLIWILLVSYHRVYDNTIIILFWVLIFDMFYRPEQRSLGIQEKLFLLFSLIGSSFLLYLPGYGIRIILPNIATVSWVQVTDSFHTLTLLMALGISLWLLFKNYPKQNLL
jgi:hypothetical protein